MPMLQPLTDWLMTPLAYNFMQRGMLAAVMVGAVLLSSGIAATRSRAWT